MRLRDTCLTFGYGLKATWPIFAIISAIFLIIEGPEWLVKTFVLGVLLALIVGALLVGIFAAGKQDMDSRQHE